MKPTKQQIVAEIANLVGFPVPHMSTGSTEPREVFDRTADVLGIGDVSALTKPEAARYIVEASGEPWKPDYESRGGTVTQHGLMAMLDAVRTFLA